MNHIPSLSHIPEIHVDKIQKSCSHVPREIITDTNKDTCRKLIEEIIQLEDYLLQEKKLLLQLQLFPSVDNEEIGSVRLISYSLSHPTLKPALMADKLLHDVELIIPVLMFEDYLDKDNNESAITRIVNYA